MKILVTLLAIAACAPAYAQTDLCASHSAFVQSLADSYGEARHMFGVVNETQVIEVFANGRTGTWTLLVTGPDGTSCMASSGTDFDDTIAPMPPNG